MSFSVDHGDGPAGSGIMGEIHSGSVHLSDRWELHQCSLRAHRDRDHHHRVWTVRMLCHVPRESMDAQTGEFSLREHIWHQMTPQNKSLSLSPSLVRHVPVSGVPGRAGRWHLGLCFPSRGENAYSPAVTLNASQRSSSVSHYEGLFWWHLTVCVCVCVCVCVHSDQVHLYEDVQRGHSGLQRPGREEHRGGQCPEECTFKHWLPSVHLFNALYLV